MTEKTRGRLATAGQIIWYLAFWFLAHIICHARVSNNLILPNSPKARFVIASNHQSRLDPFVITGILGPRFWRQLHPYRYITANQYLYGWNAMWLLWPLGGFPAYPTEREGWGLERAKQINQAGQTVCIFPEGRRSRRNETQPKRGVAVLAGMPNTYVIPIKLNWRRRRHLVEVTIGRAYKANRQTPQQILDTIYNQA